MKHRINYSYRFDLKKPVKQMLNGRERVVHGCEVYIEFIQKNLFGEEIFSEDTPIGHDKDGKPFYKNQLINVSIGQNGVEITTSDYLERMYKITGRSRTGKTLIAAMTGFSFEWKKLDYFLTVNVNNEPCCITAEGVKITADEFDAFIHEQFENLYKDNPETTSYGLREVVEGAQ